MWDFALSFDCILQLEKGQPAQGAFDFFRD